MNLLTSLIIVIFCCAMAIIKWLFNKKNSSLKQLHFQKISSLQKSIKIHNSQIANRDKGLNNYNFIKYNLDDSLIVQTEIKLI